LLWPPALRGVISLNPKITKLLAEREKNSEKIAKLTARNDEIDKQVTELENLDIVGIVRRMGVTPDELAALMQTARPSGPQSAAPVEKEDADHEET
jgi:cell division protein FtsB